MKRKVVAPLRELLRVFEFCSDEMTYYLNIETGKVAMYSNLSGGFDEKGNEIKNKNVFASNNYVEISGTHSYEVFRDMERFAERMQNLALKEKLEAVFKERGAFRRFKGLLANYPEEQINWLTFRKKCLLERIYEWLDDNDLELEQE
ncbi:MAG: hypothetical protein KAT34_11200 [Candidatus Aminicenantes bacterium]|nr:hypothetical protein [Candidatus Aminicenantes bacterium]